MKLAYSHLKELVPKLKASPEEVGRVLSLIGYMVDGVESARRNGKTDAVLSVELRQNRPDCQSLIGLARELAAYYSVSLNLPKIKAVRAGTSPLKIKVDSKAVRAIRALEIKDAKNGKSPKWLQEWLGVYGMKSISLLVDLSNAIMLLTGYPSHIIDADKLSGRLSWTDKGGHKNFVTLDRSELQLSGKELLIVDERNPIALAGLVGGTTAEISAETSHAIIEMAVYDPGVIRRDAKRLNVVTEAGIRLSRRLPVAGLDDAFALLVEMIIRESGAQAASAVFRYGSADKKAAPISFNPALPSSFAGIAIPEKKALDILKRLGCGVVGSGRKYKVTPPLFREDLELEEDLIEEVIRLVGFDQIPQDQTPALTLTRELTPVSYKLKQWLADRLRAQGFDEVLSQPLVARDANEATNYLSWKAIDTQNSVNEEYPTLRQSLLSGLLEQLKIYGRKGVEEIRIFEIGRVFGQQERSYGEHDAVAALWKADEKSLIHFQSELESLLLSLGVTDISYVSLENAPSAFNPYAAWKLMSDKHTLGIIASLKPLEEMSHLYAFEIDLEALLAAHTGSRAGNAVYELAGKIVSLDANVELSDPSRVAEKKAEIVKALGKNLWDLSVIDEFKVPQGVRYTFRVSYKDLSDQQAKEKHGRIFG